MFSLAVAFTCCATFNPCLILRLQVAHGDMWLEEDEDEEDDDEWGLPALGTRQSTGIRRPSVSYHAQQERTSRRTYQPLHKAPSLHLAPSNQGAAQDHAPATGQSMPMRQFQQQQGLPKGTGSQRGRAPPATILDSDEDDAPYEDILSAVSRPGSPPQALSTHLSRTLSAQRTQSQHVPAQSDSVGM